MAYELVPGGLSDPTEINWTPLLTHDITRKYQLNLGSGRQDVVEREDEWRITPAAAYTGHGGTAVQIQDDEDSDGGAQ